MKRLRLFLLSFLLFVLLPVTVAGAASGNTGTGISDHLFDTKHEVTSDGSKAYYQIDVTSKLPGEDEDDGIFKNAFKTVGSWISGDAIKDTVLAQFYEGMNFVVNIMFKVNVYMTNMMLTVLNYAYHFDVINRIIEKIEGVIQKITGISNLHFEQVGLYGNFLIAIGVSVGLVFIWNYFFKHAQLEATGNVVKSVLILTVSLFFFSNYGTVLKGANNITTELTGHVIGASSGLFEGKGGDSTRGLGENMWNLFVHRPYLYMQYGNDNESAVGQDRVNALLKLPPGEDRQKYVERTEVKERSNMMMTYSMVPDRLVFTVLYTIVNGITSIPIFALALLLILFQFWFLTIAVAAPFYMVIAAFPGGGGVFRRYTEELALPLLLKIAVSVVALVVFTMSAIVYEVSNSDSIGYFATAFVEFIVLLLIFILRKRFMRILMEGNRLVRSVAHEVSNFDHHVSNAAREMKRKAVKAAAQAAGGAVAGPEGAAVAGAAADASMGDNKRSEPLENVSMHDDPEAPKDEKIYADAELVKPGSEVVPYAKRADREPDIIDMPLTRLSEASASYPNSQAAAEVGAASEQPSVGKALPMLTAATSSKRPSRYRLSRGELGRARITARRGQNHAIRSAANAPLMPYDFASPDTTAGELAHREQDRAALPHSRLSMDKLVPSKGEATSSPPQTTARTFASSDTIAVVDTVPRKQSRATLPHSRLSSTMDKPAGGKAARSAPQTTAPHGTFASPDTIPVDTVHREQSRTALPHSALSSDKLVRQVPSVVSGDVPQTNVPHGRTAASAVVSLGSQRPGTEQRSKAKHDSDSFRMARGSTILESLGQSLFSQEAAPTISKEALMPRAGVTEQPAQNVSLEEEKGEREH
ncbi:CD3337/EF1877 family mobilome membrane protein [Paenibacillus ehimensis]|uniref:Uncharacterized protein n=1 Tax=Paenibacillus ehimensis TaxID=79264 RepID=A0ABT8VLH3_9BACL|nr:hypothetical protein [Paenibacillus ehimensis]MDO3681816.1 hypothetical protein [Paenibacillus ehimensis]